MEEWRDIPGWEGLYQASSLGRVRSLPQRRSRIVTGVNQVVYYRGRILKGYSAGVGYKGVTLYNGEAKHKESIHRLVCRTFHGPCPEGHEVAHTDGVRDHNAASNLRWATRSENHADKHKHGTALNRENSHQTRVTDEQIAIARKLRSEGIAISHLAILLGVTANHMSRLIGERRAPA